MTMTQRLAKVPKRGADFDDTGFRPSGKKDKTGHYPKKLTIGAPPPGCTTEEWKKKILSAESVLSKQLLHKDTFQRFRDQGWIADRALYLWKQEQEKKTKGKKDEDEEMEDAEDEDEDEDME
jgi:hypothetical protein